MVEEMGLPTCDNCGHEETDLTDLYEYDGDWKCPSCGTVQRLRAIQTTVWNTTIASKCQHKETRATGEDWNNTYYACLDCDYTYSVNDDEIR